MTAITEGALIEAPMKIIGMGSVALLLLGVAKGLMPEALFFLPLGGSTVAEIGIVLGLSASVAMIRELTQ